jgi:hypothetical protein
MELNPFVNVLSDSRKLPEECCAVRHRKGYRNTLYTNSLFAVGKKLKAVVADSHYGGIEALKYFQEQNIQTCISPRIHDSSEGRYRNTDFTVIRDGETNQQRISDPISKAEAAVQRLCTEGSEYKVDSWKNYQFL